MVGHDILLFREQLAVLVSTGKAKEAADVQLTHEQVKRFTDKEVEKYHLRYDIYVGSKATDSLIDSLIFLVSKGIGTATNTKDVNVYQQELKNDYITNMLFLTNEQVNKAKITILYARDTTTPRFQAGASWVVVWGYVRKGITRGCHLGLGTHCVLRSFRLMLVMAVSKDEVSDLIITNNEQLMASF